MSLQNIIETAFENRADITPASVTPEVKQAVEETLQRLDSGALRVAERLGVGQWKVNEWAKKAVLLSFRIADNEVQNDGVNKYLHGQALDKIDSAADRPQPFSSAHEETVNRETVNRFPRQAFAAAALGLESLRSIEPPPRQQALTPHWCWAQRQAQASGGSSAPATLARLFASGDTRSPPNPAPQGPSGIIARLSASPP